MKPKASDLIREAIHLLRLYKATIPDDRYREQFLPLIRKLEQEVIDEELNHIKSRKKQKLEDKGPDTVPQKYELDTIPSKLHSFEDELLQKRTTKCKMHPKAPHGFLEELSRNLGRYVCQCEFWDQTLERK